MIFAVSAAISFQLSVKIVMGHWTAAMYKGRQLAALSKIERDL
jgi:hypothetical protein